LSPEWFDLTAPQGDPQFIDELGPDGKKLHTCVQCGTCTVSCPAAGAMGASLRRMWRMVQLGLKEEVLHGDQMWLCSVCYLCSARCPRGIPLTDIITDLKRMAMQDRIEQYPESVRFYEVFAWVMRRYGRVREMEFMARYFLATDPLAALDYAPMALGMLTRGKIKPEVPRLVGQGRLDELFQKVAELEGRET